MRLKVFLYLAGFLVLGIGTGGVVVHYAAPLLRPAPPQLVSSGDFAARYTEPAGKPVVLFSLSTCPHCQHAREYLDAHGIAYADYVIDQSPSARKAFEEMGEAGVPVVVTARHKIRGFDPAQF